MKNKKIFTSIIVVLVSILILIVIYNLISRNSHINQGKFRLADGILSCTAQITSNTAENSALSFSATQTNNLSFLIQTSAGAEIEQIYIKGIKINKKSDRLYICQKGKEEKLISNTKELPVEWVVSENNQILLEIQALNENIVNNYILGENSTMLTHDATAFALAGIKYNDLKFKLSFKVEILEKSGKINELQVNLTLPEQEMLEKGNYVERMDLSDLVFRVK